MKLFDSHAHLDHIGFPEGAGPVIDRARAAGVEWITTIGSSADVGLMKEAIEVANDHEGVFAAIGIHPHEANMATMDAKKGLETLLQGDKVVAVGECGLDYHYMHSPKSDQIEAFKWQISLAKGRGLPLVLHCREAHEDCIDILKQANLPPVPGIIHCFSGTKTQMRDYLNLGFYVSIPGIVTFKKADDLREAVMELPLNRMLIETDSPYLAPVPFRGKRNEPAYVVNTARRIAGLLGRDLDDIAAITAENARIVYGIKA